MAEFAALSEVDSRTAGLAVSLRGVTKVYDNGVAALGPLDLDVGRTEFVSLLGPSGCGKSTALRLIAGLGSPTSGTVGVSQPPGEARAGRSIGFVFQEPTLMPWTSVRENVRLPLKLGACADCRGERARRRGIDASGAFRIRRRLPARIVGRHEDAGLAGARIGDRSGYPPDG